MRDAQGRMLGAAPVQVRRALAAWYLRHGRELCFRGRRDPWSVLVSEVMAQQTQVTRVEPAWATFLEAFPTPAALAAASPADALRAWAGLGYNRRAVNLRRAAAEMVERHGGQVPRELPELEALPGVGPYTARAVAAIAFERAVAAVDTNIGRVVGRMVAGHGDRGDPGTALRPADLQAAADALVDAADPAAWTHAMMDVGATVCRPRAPHCVECPLRPGCRWAGRHPVPPAAPGEVPQPGATCAAEDAHPPGAHVVAPTTLAGLRARAARSPATCARQAVMPFPATSRWLRGRIIDRLRSSPDGAWLALCGPIGLHDELAVSDAIAALERDGLLERGPGGAVRLPQAPARLPQAPDRVPRGSVRLPGGSLAPTIRT